MKANLARYGMTIQPTLAATLQALAETPGHWTPFAGGTDLMVFLESGSLPPQNFLSLLHLPELRGITITPQTITLGALTTHREIRENPLLQQEFPNLCQAARETGAISIQNRGTLGGNLANASPAADSPPALLSYDAELELISQRGSRRIPYRDFHFGYKKTQRAPDELIIKIILNRISISNSRIFRHFYRKVGTRKAQSIAKIGLAGFTKVREGRCEDIRISFASVAPIPIRCLQMEAKIRGEKWNPLLVREIPKFLAQEIKPIADIRSTSEYRLHIAQRLLLEMLRQAYHVELDRQS